METLYVVKDGKIMQYDGQTKEKSLLNEAAVIESYGRKAIEDINRFGVYNIKK
ncbi:hypothetical protein [Cohnella yongneupensis]|uniref:Uncharacterized protein n=1 Tax=Cohnella yongneupensis TaxID=425006 RepID=A0ABW0QUU7_9BACL